MSGQKAIELNLQHELAEHADLIGTFGEVLAQERREIRKLIDEARAEFATEMRNLRREFSELRRSLRTPEVRGTYDPDETYLRLDIVALNGGSFIARCDRPGPCPGPDWQLMAARGKHGRPGDRT